MFAEVLRLCDRMICRRRDFFPGPYMEEIYGTGGVVMVDIAVHIIYMAGCRTVKDRF